VDTIVSGHVDETPASDELRPVELTPPLGVTRVTALLRFAREAVRPTRNIGVDRIEGGGGGARVATSEVSDPASAS
jgi:hypothetical protein